MLPQIDSPPQFFLNPLGKWRGGAKGQLIFHIQLMPGHFIVPYHRPCPLQVIEFSPKPCILFLYWKAGVFHILRPQFPDNGNILLCIVNVTVFIHRIIGNSCPRGIKCRMGCHIVCHCFNPPFFTHVPLSPAAFSCSFLPAGSVSHPP